MKKIITIIALIVITALAINLGINSQERGECHRWQANPAMVTQDWQRQQCLHHKLPIPTKPTQAEVKPTQAIQPKPGKASFYDYILPSGWSSKGHRVCASRDHKRGVIIRVTNVKNGKQVDCLVTDYGPDKKIFPDRVVDLSSHAFAKIADPKLGLAMVTIKEVK